MVAGVDDHRTFLLGAGDDPRGVVGVDEIDSGHAFQIQPAAQSPAEDDVSERLHLVGGEIPRSGRDDDAADHRHHRPPAFLLQDFVLETQLQIIAAVTGAVEPRPAVVDVGEEVAVPLEAKLEFIRQTEPQQRFGQLPA